MQLPPLPPTERGRWAWCAAIVALVALATLLTAHVQRHVRGPRDESECRIVQVTAADASAALLAQRRPLVIEDRVVDPAQLLDTVFRWQYVRTTRYAVGPGQSALAAGRFTLLWFDPALERDGGSGGGGNAVAIHCSVASLLVRLGSGMVLVLPPGWTFEPTSLLGQPCVAVRLDDPVSVTFSPKHE
jgi:hypothetical protein